MGKRKKEKINGKRKERKNQGEREDKGARGKADKNKIREKEGRKKKNNGKRKQRNNQEEREGKEAKGGKNRQKESEGKERINYKKYSIFKYTHPLPMLPSFCKKTLMIYARCVQKVSKIKMYLPREKWTINETLIYLNFWDKAWWLLSIRIFRLSTSS